MTKTSEWTALPGWEVTADGMLSLPCPTALIGSARTFLAGASTPATPRLAATVMLVRLGRGDTTRQDIEVFMLRRSAGMAFAAGALVFPGGAVDDRDGEEIGWAGPSPQQWASRLGCPPAEARRVVVAAVRELFEESGVLLAGTDSTHVAADLGTPDWMRDLRRLAAGETSLAEVLTRRGLVLRSDLLGVRGHWVTPEFEPRRYDTYFFAARLPDGQTTNSVTTEAVAVRWVTPLTVLEAAAHGKLGLLPPTAHGIARLAECVSAEQFVGEDLVVDRLMLAPAERPDGAIALTCRLPGPPGSRVRTSGSAAHQKENSQ